MVDGAGFEPRITLRPYFLNGCIMLKWFLFMLTVLEGW
jgi:hypothetical protein